MNGSSDDNTDAVSNQNPRTRSSHPWKRRKRIVEDHGDDDVHIDDEYEFPVDFWETTLLQSRRGHRPWPSSQVLSSTLASSTTTKQSILKSPFLQRFYQSIGISNPEDQIREEDDRQEKARNEETNDDPNLEELDNPSLSTLAPSQHRRYLKLLQQTERRTPAERNHWKQLSSIVPSEQNRYRQAVAKFWMKHKEDRLMLGLSPKSPLNQFCQWACRENKQRVKILFREGESLPKFGQCRQILSLRGWNNAEDVDVTSLNLQNVASPESQYLPLVSDLPSVGTRLMLPKQNVGSTQDDLFHDAKATQLCIKHKASIVTTDTILETLLRVPGDSTTTWTIPVVSKNGIIIMENPLPQAHSSPRECLERGMDESLFQHIEKNVPSADLKPGTFRYRYMLWTLPATSSTRRSNAKALIRTRIRLRRNDSMDTPVQLRCHVEFFPERGTELVSRFERSLWILDQILLKASQLCRVDGRNGNVLGWEETSVAHAFAADAKEEQNPMQGFAQIIHFFQAVSTIDFGGEDDPDLSNGNPLGLPQSRVLCLPGIGKDKKTLSDPYSVSVHAPSSVEDCSVHLEPILQQADGILMNPKALREMQRPWKWDTAERIPYTFPTSGKNTNN